MSQTHEKYHLGKQNTTFVTLVYYNSHSQSNSKRKRLPKKQDTNSYLIFSTARRNSQYKESTLFCKIQVKIIKIGTKRNLFRDIKV